MTTQEVEKLKTKVNESIAELRAYITNHPVWERFEYITGKVHGHCIDVRDDVGGVEPFVAEIDYFSKEWIYTEHRQPGLECGVDDRLVAFDDSCVGPEVLIMMAETCNNAEPYYPDGNGDPIEDDDEDGDELLVLEGGVA